MLKKSLGTEIESHCSLQTIVLFTFNNDLYTLKGNTHLVNISAVRNVVLLHRVNPEKWSVVISFDSCRRDRSLLLPDWICGVLVGRPLFAQIWQGSRRRRECGILPPTYYTPQRTIPFFFRGCKKLTMGSRREKGGPSMHFRNCWVDVQKNRPTPEKGLRSIWWRIDEEVLKKIWFQ